MQYFAVVFTLFFAIDLASARHQLKHPKWWSKARVGQMIKDAYPTGSTTSSSTSYIKHRHPSFFSSSYQKFILIDKVMPILGNLPLAISNKAVKLHRRRNFKRLNILLNAVTKLDKLYREQKCEAMFSKQICNNSSPQPFYMWAKISANKIIQG